MTTALLLLTDPRWHPRVYYVLESDSCVHAFYIIAGVFDYKIARLGPDMIRYVDFITRTSR
jgi:hypothetical protein